MTRKTCTNPPHVDIVLQSVCHQLGLYDCHSQKKHLTRHKYQDISSDLLKLKHCRTDPAVALFLKINGIALTESFKEDKFSYKMPTTRTSSLSSKAKQTPLSSSSTSYSERLRTRKQTPIVNNFTDTSGDDDSNHIKPIKELRSSSRLALALVKSVERRGQDTWESGRPKRTCIKNKRASADERLVVDNKSYYKVEILSNKLRSSGLCNRDSDTPVLRRLRSPPSYCEDSDDEKVGKFKSKLRDTELIRLNNEAESFLFPPKDESSSEEDVTTPSPPPVNKRKRTATVTAASTPIANHKPVRNCKTEPERSRKRESERNQKNESERNHKNVPEEESSMDSTSSEMSTTRKRRRLTQAEAFILDNQKYYKFETPGSRLRYQGSYLAAIPPKNNGEHVSKQPKNEKCVKSDKVDLNLDELKFSFETTPNCESWYKTFQRQDNADESYSCYNYNTGFYKPFLLPYEVGPLPPLDPGYCYDNYQQLKKHFYDKCGIKMKPDSDSPIKQEENSSSATLGTGSDETKSSEDIELELEPKENQHPKKKYYRRSYKRKLFNVGRNPRKSPRQHASTLAILSNFIHQRKRKEKLAKAADKSLNLSTVSENIIKEEEEIDYDKIAKNIDEMLNGDLEDLECDDIGLNDGYSFDLHCNLDPVKMLEDCINCKESDEPLDISSPLTKNPNTNTTGKTTGRKVGRKRKKNRTGWPNKNRRVLFRKDDTSSETQVSTENPDDDKNQADSSKKQAEPSKKQAEPNKKQAEPSKNQADFGKKQAEPSKKLVEPNKKQAEPSKNQADSGKKQAEPSKKQADPSEKQPDPSEKQADSSEKQAVPSETKKLTKLLKEINTNDEKINGGAETIKINGCTNLKSMLGSPKRKEHRGSSSDNCAEVVIASVGDKIDCVNVDLDKWESAERVLSAKLRSETINNDIHFQPIVRVQKLDTNNIMATAKRNNKLIKNNNIVSSKPRTRPRRMPASPKSPRIFRRPRGACYRERYSERINYN